MKTITRCGLILVMILSSAGIGWPATGQTNQSQLPVKPTPEFYYPANALITQHNLQPLEEQQETIVSVLAPIEPVQVGQLFSLTVAITQVNTPLSAFQFDLTYDSTLIAFRRAAPSSFLGRTGRMVVCPDSAEGEGVVRLACASTGEGPGVSGAGDLIVLTFVALRAGKSDLTLGDVRLLTDARPPMLVTDFILQTTAITVTAAVADLEIVKSAQTDVVTAGQSITYILTATNHGPTSVDALITDTLSPMEAYGEIRMPSGCTGAGPILCNLPAFTGTRSITLGVTTAATFSGTLTNHATITVTTFGVVDDKADNNNATAQVTVYPADVCNRPLSAVNISGPNSGYTDTAYTFSANIIPPDASEPVLYTWMPQPQDSLLLPDRSGVTYTWTTTGTKILTVTAENCGGIFSDTASVVIQAQTHTPIQRVFLPLILKDFPPPPPCSIPPTLLSPSNGGTLNTLIPMFQWDNGNDPDATAGTLVVGPNLGVSFGRETLMYSPAQGIWTYRFMKNFAPASTYYWRTQLICDGTDSPVSETWSFTTGAGGTILSASSLISPIDGSTIATLKTTLQWSAVDGAVGYLVRWQKVGESTVRYGWLTDPQKEVWLEADATYEWWVSAYNEYALGDDSVKWQFTTPAEDVHAQLSNWGHNKGPLSTHNGVHLTDTSFPLRIQSHDDHWADLDGDHDVDGADLKRIADYWNCASGDTCYAPLYDMNVDQIIDAWDLARVGNEYDITPPAINILSPAQGQVVGAPEVLVTGILTDAHTVLSVTVNSTVATLDGTTFTATVPLAMGSQVLNVVAEDELGQKGLTSRIVVMDGDGPMIQINTPKHRQAVYTLTPTVAISYTDFYTSVDVASLSAQILDESGTSLDVIGDLTVMNDGASGTVSVPLVDDASYTLTVSLADIYGNTSSASSAFYVPPDPMHIVLPDEPDRAGWVSGVVYDSTACDAYLLTCQGLPGAAVTLAYSGGLAITGTIVTGPDGFFAFPLAETGQYWLRVEKEGYTYGQRAAEVVRERSAATNNIYLTPLDPVVTLCDDSGCNHTNSDGTVQVEIPAGAVPPGDIVTTTATNFEHVEFLPSGELPPETWETYAFNLGGDSEVTFTQPITVRIQNDLGFSPTTKIPLGYWNQATLQWEHAGTGVVDASGAWVVMTVTHFSNYDCNYPVPPPRNPDPEIEDGSDDNDDKDECKPGENGCFVGFKSGTLEESISLPTINILGEQIAPVLRYNSQRVNPVEIIDVKLSLDMVPDAEIGNHIGFELYIEGIKTDSFYFSSTLQSGEIGRYRYLWNGRDAQGNLLPPGIYEYAIKFSIPYRTQYCAPVDGIFGYPPDCELGATGVFVDVTRDVWVKGTVELDTQQDSFLGAGWVLDGLQRLYENDIGHILISDNGQKSEFYFAGKYWYSLRPPIQNTVSQRTPVIHQEGRFCPGALPCQDEAARTVSIPAQVNTLPWTNIANYPFPVMDNAVVEYNGLVYSVGGYDGVNRLSTGYIYHPSTDTWQQIANMNAVHQKAAAVFVDGLLYVIGGWDNNTEPSNMMEIYSPATGGWWTGAPIPVGRAAASGVELGGKIYVIGGCTDLDCFAISDAVYRYDPSTDTWTSVASYPEPTAHNACGAIAGQIFCTGGLNSYSGGTIGTASAHTYSYNPVADRWIAWMDMPQPWIGMFSTVADGNLYISGGVINDFTAVTNESFYFNPNRDLWFQIENANLARWRGGSACGFYKIGGDANYFAPSGEAEMYPGLTNCSSKPVISPRTVTDNSRLEYDPASDTYTRIYPDGIQVRFNPDGMHNYTLEPDGRKTIYIYNSDGTLAMVRIVPPGEATPRWTWSFAYQDGKLMSITDPAGRITTFVVDEHNHLTSTSDPEGGTRKYAYNQDHLLTHFTEENGAVTIYDYDSYGRIASITDPSRPIYLPASGQVEMTQTVRYFTPSDTSYPLINTSPTGDPDNPAPPVPTSADLVDRIEYGRGSRSGHTNKWGFWLDETDGLGRTTYYQRDDANNLTRVDYPDGTCTEYTYDALGNQLSEENMEPDQCALTRAARDTTQVKSWTYTYEERFNQIKSETDPLGNTTTYVYDYEEGVGEAGNLIRVEYPSVKDEDGDIVTPTVHYTYNALGILDTETDERGTVTQYVYTQGTPDEASDGTNPLFAPGVIPVPGLLTQMIRDYGDATHLNQTTTYKDFDASGKPMTVLGPGGIAGGGTGGCSSCGTQGAVQSAGQTAEGTVTRYTYDTWGHTLTEDNALGIVTKYEYDAKGNLVKKVEDYTPDGTTGRNITTKYIYNANDQLLSVHTVADGIIQQRVYDYDINGQLTTRTDNNSNTTVYIYDNADQLVAETDPLGYTTTYSYTLSGRVDGVTRPNGSVTRYIYDDLGRQVQEIVDYGELNLTTNYSYDLDDNLLTMTDPAGTITCYTYNGLGRLISETQDCGRLNLITTYIYDVSGNLIRLTDERGVVTLNTYDALGRQTSTHRDATGLNLETTYGYDKAGNLVSITDERGGVTTYEYNTLNQQTRICEDVLELNLCTNYAYDHLGNLKTITDPNGMIVRTEYNAFERPMHSVEDYDNLDVETRYAYDNNLNLTAVTDANVNTTSYSYNERNQRTQTHYADSTTIDYGYNPDRTLAWRIDQAGDRVDLTYDGAFRLLNKSYPDGSTQTFTYDAMDRQTSAQQVMNGHTTKVSFAYDALGNVISTTQTVDGISWTTNYTYDYLIGMVTVTYPSGVQVAQTLDALGRLKAVMQDGTPIAIYTYNDATDTTILAHANGVTTTTETDILDRIIRVHIANTSNIIADYRYGYDAVGNRTYMQRWHESGQPANVYQYDSLYQLTQVWYDANNINPDNITSYNHFQLYDLDNVGNRLEVQNDGVSEIYLPNDGQQLTNSMHRYEQVDGRVFIYDTKGNLLNDGGITYTYDYENRQTGISGPDSTAEYVYNALGQRVAKVRDDIITYFVYNSNSQTIEERDASGQLLARYIYGTDINDLLEMETNGVSYVYHRDALGSITEVTDSSGNLQERYTYDVYGTPYIFNNVGNVLVSSSISNTYLFTGQRYDLESHNYYYRARTYAPGIGRFLQMDPAGYIDGMNLYIYAKNSPIYLTDPTGLASEKCCKEKGWVVLKFGPKAKEWAFSAFSEQVLVDILRSACLKYAKITSTYREPSDQARAMFNNLEGQGVKHQRQLYRRSQWAQQVIDIYVESKREGKTDRQIKADMTAKINEVGVQRISKHGRDPEVWGVFDVAPGSIGDRRAFEEAARADWRVSKFIPPPIDPAYHFEIPQGWAGFELDPEATLNWTMSEQ